jgi:hypothetical protein
VATVTEVAGGDLLNVNTGAASLQAFIPLLGGQIDAAISLGLTSLKSDLGAQLNAALATQATLSLTLTNPFQGILDAIAALTQLQANLTAALALPPVNLSISGEIAASASLAASLAARLGAIDGAISAALNVKIPAVKLGGTLGDALSAGPFLCLSFDGITDLTDLQSIGALIASKFSSTISFGPNSIDPTDPVSGVIILTTAGLAFTALGQLIAT